MNEQVESSTALLERTVQTKVNAGYLIAKRVSDIICSLLIMILLLPVILIIALLIFIDDPHGSPFLARFV